MDEATQALLADVPGIDRNDPAIQAALAVMRLEKPQAPRPSAEPRNIMRQNYGWVLYKDPVATLDDLREAVTTIKDVLRVARRVLGSAHRHTTEIEDELRCAQAALLARGTPSSGGAEVLQTADDLAACFG